MAAASPVARANRISPLAAPSDAALTDLYERHAKRIFGFCLRWLRSREEAEDAVQTTFLYAMRGLRRGVVPAVEAAWLLTIARNVCLSRTEAARRRAVEVVHDPQVLADSVAAPPRSEELEGLPEALNGLTEQQRRAILMREWQGLSYREIAEELELSQAAVETLLFRARRSLASRLRSAGSFLPWLKSLTGLSGAGKLAIGATIVAVTAAAGTVAGGGHEPQPAPAKQAAAPAFHAAGSSVHVTMLPRRAGSLRSRSTRPAGASAPSAPAAPREIAPAGGSEAAPASQPVQRPTTTSQQPPEAASATFSHPGGEAGSSLTQTVADTTKPVVDTVGDPAGAIIAIVTSAAGTVDDVAGNAVGSAVGTAAGAAANVAAAATANVRTIPAVPLGGAGSSLPILGPLTP